MKKKNQPDTVSRSRKILKEIISGYGNSVITDPKKFQSLFNDLTKGECKRESNLLFDSISENIPADLLKSKDLGSLDIVVPRLVNRLFQNRSIDRNHAEWVIYSWAFALGLIDENDPLIQQTETTQQDSQTSTSGKKSAAYSIDIHSNPSGGTVFLGGNKIGNASFTAYLSEGEHTLWCSLIGYESQCQTISVPKNHSITFQLKRIVTPTYTITITTKPLSADVYLDGVNQGKSPVTIPGVKDGMHDIVCSLDGYEDLQKTIAVNNDSTFSYYLTEKTPPVFTITIKTDPPGADLEIDGKKIGKSPVSIPLMKGSFQLSCNHPNFKPLKKSLDVVKDTDLTIPLEPLKKTITSQQSSLLISSDPSGAEIFIDGHSIGITPKNIPFIPFGSYNLLLKLSGFDPVQKTVSVPKETSVYSKLKRKTPLPSQVQSSYHQQKPGKSPTQKPFGGNKGLLMWVAFSLILILVYSFTIGIIGGMQSSHQAIPPATGVTGAAIIPPSMNQSDSLLLQNGISYLNSGRYADALKEFESATAINPQSAAAWNYQSYCLYKLGRYDESIRAGDKSLALDSSLTAAWTTKGWSLNLLERYQEAIPVFRQALSQDPGSIHAINGIGISYYSLKNFSAAIDSFEKVIAISPTDKTAWTYRGRTLQAQKKYSDAVAAYNVLLANNSGDIQILLDKGDCLIALSDYQNATPLYSNILIKDPQNERAMTGWGTSLMGQGKYQDALTSFNNALSVDSNNVNALIGKSRALLKMKNSVDSLQIANRVLEIDPNNAEALLCKAEIWEEQSKYTDALQTYDEVLKIAPDSEEALIGKASVMIKMEDYSGSISVLDHALSMYPLNKELWNKQGYALLKNGESGKADVALNKAIELDPKYVLAWSNKGYALSAAGNYDQSLQAFNKAIELNPNFKDAWLGKSIVYTKMGDFKASEEAAKQALSIKL